MALKKDGSIRAWDTGTYGQCNVPGGYNFIAIDASDSHSLAIKDDGTILAEGYIRGFVVINKENGEDYEDDE